MKQTGENGKTKFFSTTSIGLCALCTFFVKSQLTFLKVNTLTVTIVGSSLTHQKSWGWGGRNNQSLWFGVQNRIWQSAEAHHKLLYRSAHSSFCISCILLKMYFILYILQLFFHLTLKKEKLPSSRNHIPHTAKQMYRRLTSAQYRV